MLLCIPQGLGEPVPTSFTGAARVLIAEPSMPDLARVSSALTSMGLEVVVANSKPQARQLAADPSIALVITEPTLPHSNGLELVSLSRGLPHRPVFLLIHGGGDVDFLPPPQDDVRILGTLHRPFELSDLAQLAARAAEVLHLSSPLLAEKFAPRVLLLSADRSNTLRDALTHAFPLAEVEEATLLDQAEELVRTRDFDIALAELHVPDALGVDAVRRLHASSRDLTIVAVAEDSPEIANWTLAAGAQETIPLRPDATTLHHALTRALLRKRCDRSVRYQADHDGLTGLCNQARFRAHLGQAMARARRNDSQLAVMYLDLDGFKPVNDQLGHPAGDVVLRTVARRLQQATRGTDVCARLGGDEFVVLLEDPQDIVNVRTVAHRLLSSLAAPISIDAKTTARVTASVGISMFPRSATTADALLDSADAAMFTAKRSGQSQYSIAPDPRDSQLVLRGGDDLHAELYAALLGGDLHMVYQPQVSLDGGGVIGLEALLRWRRRKGPKIGPDQFVPVLEETGLIEEVGMFALREACAHARRWQVQHGRTVRVAINVSPRQLEREGFARQVLDEVQVHDLEPEQLEIEVTESVLMRDCDIIRQGLAELGDHGIRIVLDDFGTGYASLGYLRTFPFSGVKIDRTFVEPVDTDPTARVMVGGMIDLIHKLGMTVVAEGVERVEQLAFLREKGCDVAQGFLFGHPHFPGRPGPSSRAPNRLQHGIGS